MLETDEQHQTNIQRDEKPDPSRINSEYHIIYKRKDSHVDHMSDYRKLRQNKLYLVSIFLFLYKNLYYYPNIIIFELVQILWKPTNFR